jgi:hypothetical protein
MSGEIHALAALPRGKTLGTHWIKSWVCTKPDLNAVEKKYKFLSLARIEPMLSSPKLYHYTN